jgi:hypothetical protein
MLKWLGLVAIVFLFVSFGIYREPKRSMTHWLVLFIASTVLLITVGTAIHHYREVAFLKMLDEADVVYVTVGKEPRIVDQRRIGLIVHAMKSPVEFLASRGNHGEPVQCTLGIKGGIQKHFELSLATKTRGVVVRIPGGGAVLYRELEWLIPEKPHNDVQAGADR